jgi:hypothetical protein
MPGVRIEPARATARYAPQGSGRRVRAADLCEMWLGGRAGLHSGRSTGYADNEVETPPPDEPGRPVELFILPEVPLRELIKPRRNDEQR